MRKIISFAMLMSLVGDKPYIGTKPLDNKSR
jgi:hypothetical protein